MERPLLSLSRINKFYGEGGSRLQVLKDVTLRVGKGEFLSIVGASGSGKSTLLNLIGCLDRPSSGEYELHGEEVSKLSDDRLSATRNREIGFIFQSFNLIPQLTVLENVEVTLFYSEVGRAERRRIAERQLERFGLSHRLGHFPSQLSGGEQQRVAAARALVNNPSLLLADEPTGNLDTKSGEEVIRLLWELHAEGKTVLLVTHNPEIAESTPRRIELRDGRILRDETPLAARTSGEVGPGGQAGQLVLS